MVEEKYSYSNRKKDLDSRITNTKIPSLITSKYINNSNIKKDIYGINKNESYLDIKNIENKTNMVSLEKRNVTLKDRCRSYSEVNLKDEKLKIIENKEDNIKDLNKYCCICKRKLLDNDELYEDTVEFHRKIFSSRKNVCLDDFHTIAIIGQGGYSIVRLVFDIYTGHVYALKQSKKNQIVNKKCSMEDMENLSEIDINSPEKNMDKKPILNTGLMLNTEIGLMYNCNSPWINKLYYYWEDNYFYFMLMEYMPGGDLMRHLIDLHTFDEDMAKFYIAEILLGLDYLNNNKGHIHRDIKPDNILLDMNGHIKLIDFGLSKQIRCEKQHPFVSNVAFNLQNKLDNNKDMNLDDILIYDSNFHAGTPDYMAPEIHRGEPYSLCVDLWSVGIILYEMLFGGPPLSDPGQNSLITRNKVMNWDKYFYLPSDHHKYTREALDFICSLVCEPNQRIRNTKDAMKHPFFKGIDFENIRFQKPPITPIVRHKLDHSNFDKFSDDILLSFYNSVKIPSNFLMNISEDMNIICNNMNSPNFSLNNTRKYTESGNNELISNTTISGLNKFNNSHNFIEISHINSTNNSKIPICTPKRSYVPLLNSTTPVSNSTTSSTWKHINNSPVYQTPKKLSPIKNLSNSNIINSNSLINHNIQSFGQNHSFSPIISRSFSSYCLNSKISNNLANNDKINLNIYSKTNNKNITTNLNQCNLNNTLHNKFFSYKERNISENIINRQSSYQINNLLQQRSTSSSIANNNQTIMNLLRKK